MGFVHMWETLNLGYLTNSFLEPLGYHKPARGGTKESILKMTIGKGFLPLLMDKPSSNPASPPDC